MKTIPIAAMPAQQFQVVLDGQYCVIALKQKGPRLYLDLLTGDNQVCRGAVCVNGAEIVQSPSPYFKGGLYFLDMKGQSAPHFSGLGERYRLFYIAENE